MRTMIILFLFVLNVLSCATKKNMILGTYVVIGYINTFDTLILHDRGEYERKVYDKNNKLVLKMNGIWEVEEEMLVLKSFFLNLDRDIALYPELIADTSMRMEALVEIKNKDVRFCTGYLNNTNCYRKIK